MILAEQWGTIKNHDREAVMRAHPPNLTILNKYLNRKNKRLIKTISQQFDHGDAVLLPSPAAVTCGGTDRTADVVQGQTR